MIFFLIRRFLKNNQVLYSSYVLRQSDSFPFTLQSVKKKHLTTLGCSSNITEVMKVNEILEQALLYDFYGELLTSHQKEIYEQFVLEDLSLSEIAQDAGISRQGVHDLVKRCQKILEGYEEKLHLVRRFLSIKENVHEIEALLDQ